ncbi:MAG: hypothetical protein J4G16_10660 [Acidobacteria bacterium]|nr:hypothetical protein [Acidobacteriota bacterium]
MTPELQTVLEIAGVGSTLLFLSLGGLVTLMYALTSPLLYGGLRLSGGSGTSRTKAAERARLETAAEQERQRQAVAIAVAVARARAARPAPLESDGAAWRRLHRAQRFAQSTERARVRL